MKKHFLSSVWAHVCTALLILSISFIVYSCHKEAKLTQQEINAAKAAQNFSVTDASTWFNDSKSTLANKIKLTADVDFLKDLSDFKPIWDSARTAIDTNYYVVEAPARYAKRWGFNTDSTTANINGLTRLLVLKSKKYGSTTAVLMHIHGNPGVNAANVHYMDVPQTFSGNIFYTSLQGASINGYIYKNGKIILASSGKSNTTKPTGPQILDLAPGECETVTTYWYEQTCYYTNNDELIGCAGWQYTHTTIDTYCAPIGGNTGGGGGVTQPDCPPDTGSGGGGGTTPPNDPPPGGGIITINRVGGRLIVKINDNTSVSGGTQCTPLGAIASVTDSLKSKCLKNAKAAVTDTAIKNLISNFYNKNILSSSGPINLEISERSNAEHNDFITTRNDGSGIKDTIFAMNTHVPGTNVWKIFLNNDYLSYSGYNMSQEAWGQIIIHELLHVIYQSTYTEIELKGLDHAMIMKSLITPSKDLLKSAFGISESDAMDLAINGIADMQQYSTFESYIQTNYSRSLNQVKTTFKNYTKQTAGTKCPTQN